MSLELGILFFSLQRNRRISFLYGNPILKKGTMKWQTVRLSSCPCIAWLCSSMSSNKGKNTGKENKKKPNTSNNKRAQQHQGEQRRKQRSRDHFLFVYFLFFFFLNLKKKKKKKKKNNRNTQSFSPLLPLSSPPLFFFGCLDFFSLEGTVNQKKALTKSHTERNIK